MYARPTDRVESRSDALELLEAAALVHLVSIGASGFEATSLPMVVDRASDRLIGHVARANPHWRALDDAAVIAIATASDAYVSPAWYPSERTNGGRVVPTWNYEAVHVHGVAHVHQDPQWLADVVHRLTEVHEARRTDRGDRWAVSDAPERFVEQQLKAIVGISVSIDRVEAKQKLSVNREDADRVGVIDGLAETDGAPARMIEAMSRSLGSDDD